MNLIKELEGIQEKQAGIKEKTTSMVGKLNSMLVPMGYTVIAINGHTRGRRPKLAIPGLTTNGAHRGRKSMSAEEKAAVSKRMKAYWAKRRKEKKATAKAGDK